MLLAGCSCIQCYHFIAMEIVYHGVQDLLDMLISQHISHFINHQFMCSDYYHDHKDEGFTISGIILSLKAFEVDYLSAFKQWGLTCPNPSCVFPMQAGVPSNNYGISKILDPA